MTFDLQSILERSSDAHSNGSRNPAEATTFLQTNQVSLWQLEGFVPLHVLT